MKRTLFALTIVGLLLLFTPRSQADPEVSLNFFYDNLSPYGNWIEVGDYGYCFQPSVAVGSSDWRPYSDGYWAYTDSGWTWVSYEDFGWATYHYGRWANLDDYGWVWIPGYEWGPAWVSWRTGGDYVGWAPLPPEPVGVVYEGQAITGAVDIAFGIGPLYYNFVDIRYIGEPVLRNRIYAPARNITIINNTVNVTNITYKNSTVYNYGPDYNRLNKYSTRPIQRLKLQRETTVGANFDRSGRRENLNRVNGNQLLVVAPQIEKSQQPGAPRQVKARVDKPRVEHGWQGIADRQQLESQMRKENSANVPPPRIQPQKGHQATTTEIAPDAGDSGNTANTGKARNPGNSGAAGYGMQGDRAGQSKVNPPSKVDDVELAPQQKQGKPTGALHQTDQQKARQDKQRTPGQQTSQAQHVQEPPVVHQSKPQQVYRPQPQAVHAPSQPIYQRKPQVRQPPPPPQQNPNPQGTSKDKKKKPGDDQPPS